MSAVKVLGFVFSAALALLGAGMMWGGTQMGYSNYGVPGAGFFPVWSGLVLAVAGIAFVLPAARADRLEDDLSVPRQFVAIAMVVGFLLLNETIGTLGAVVVYLAASIGFVGRHSPAIAALCSLVSAAIVYAVFEVWLRTPLLEASW